MKPKIKIPYGLRVLRLLSGVGILFVGFMIIVLSISITQPSGLSNLYSSNILVSIFYFLLISLEAILVIIAINKRSESLYKIVKWLFIVDIPIVLILDPQFRTWNIEAVLQGILLIAISLFVLWYWIKMKKYFTDVNFDPEDPTVKRVDRKVNPAIILYIFLSILIPLFTSGKDKVEEINVMVGYSEQFKGKSIEDNITYCNQVRTEYKEKCMLLAITIQKTVGEVDPKFCGDFSIEIKPVCYGIIERCDLVSTQEEKLICNYATEKQKTLNKATSTASRGN